MADTYDGWLIFHDAYVNYEFLYVKRQDVVNLLFLTLLEG